MRAHRPACDDAVGWCTPGTAGLRDRLDRGPGHRAAARSERARTAVHRDGIRPASVPSSAPTTWPVLVAALRDGRRGPDARRPPRASTSRAPSASPSTRPVEALEEDGVCKAGTTHCAILVPARGRAERAPGHDRRASREPREPNREQTRRSASANAAPRARRPATGGRRHARRGVERKSTSTRVTAAIAAGS